MKKNVLNFRAIGLRDYDLVIPASRVASATKADSGGSIVMLRNPAERIEVRETLDEVSTYLSRAL